jgi:hypothetical protein
MKAASLLDGRPRDRKQENLTVADNYALIRFIRLGQSLL